MSLNEAIKFLRNYVKFSHLESQKHIDPALVNATDLPTFEQALKVSRVAVNNGEISEEDLKQALGLN